MSLELERERYSSISERHGYFTRDSEWDVTDPQAVRERYRHPHHRISYKLSEEQQSPVASYHEQLSRQLWNAVAQAGEQVQFCPRKLGGIPVLRGTRFSLAQLFAELADSDVVVEIANDFELDERQLRKTLYAFSLYYDIPSASLDERSRTTKAGRIAGQE